MEKSLGGSDSDTGLLEGLWQSTRLMIEQRKRIRSIEARRAEREAMAVGCRLLLQQ